jgi:hypothetical protein
MTTPAHGAPEDSNARVFRWLRAGTAWRPFTAALLLLGLLFGAAVDYATSQREDLCHANNRTTSLVKQLVEVTFDDGTPENPDAPTPTPGAQRIFVEQRLAQVPEFQALAPDEQQEMVTFVLILSSLSGGGGGTGTTEARLRGLADSLVLDECPGALVF